MYDTMLVTVFDDEAAAYKGATALKEMHATGDITVYAMGVIGKDADGTVSLKQGFDEGPIGMAIGTLIGGMVGLIGGPAGVAVGMLGGLSLGAMRDIYVAGVDSTFLEDVGTYLTPGKSAVVAEIFEGWQVPIDQRMTDAGGTVFRKPRVDVVDDQLEREAEALNAEWEALRSEVKDANDEAKANLQSSIDNLKARIQKTNDKAKARLKEVNDLAKAKIDALQAQIQTAAAESKAKYEKRSAEIKEDLDARGEKLEKAIKLTGEALAP